MVKIFHQTSNLHNIFQIPDYMDEILLRFPHIFGAIIGNLDDKDLTNCRLVSKLWKNGIDTDRCLYKGIINKLILKANSDKENDENIQKFGEEGAKELAEAKAVESAAKAKNWKPFLLKAPLDILMEIPKMLLGLGLGKHESDKKNPNLFIF